MKAGMRVYISHRLFLNAITAPTKIRSQPRTRPKEIAWNRYSLSPAGCRAHSNLKDAYSKLMTLPRIRHLSPVALLFLATAPRVIAQVETPRTLMVPMRDGVRLS